MTLVADEPDTAAGRLGDQAAQAYVAAALANLAALRTSTDWGWLGISRPRPTAAFSRRDTLVAGYPQATEVARRHGFEPIIRPAGGRLAAYHQSALILDVVARHPSPAAQIDQRFRVFGHGVASALQRLGVDARVGPVAGEYCPGRFSVNGGGRTKLAGIAQRLTGRSFLLTAIVLVSDPDPIRAVLAECYPRLGYTWEPGTVGCVSEQVRGITMDDVQAVLADTLAGLLPLGPPALGPPGMELRLPLVECWQPAG